LVNEQLVEHGASITYSKFRLLFQEGYSTNQPATLNVAGNIVNNGPFAQGSQTYALITMNGTTTKYLGAGVCHR